jgi:hypothetical protein
MKRVQCYYNIRRGDYSVRQDGKVIDHVDSITLLDARFNVAPAGRDKVRATGVKNVHATVSGYIVRHASEWARMLDIFTVPTRPIDIITYNPFMYDQFVKLLQCDMYSPLVPVWSPVYSAEYVKLLPNREIRALGAK